MSSTVAPVTFKAIAPQSVRTANGSPVMRGAQGVVGWGVVVTVLRGAGKL